MTKKEATQILIKAAINDITGSGRGVRITTDEWRLKVKIAVKVMWKHIYKREMTPNEQFNNSLN
jgi:hypothetical protein